MEGDAQCQETCCGSKFGSEYCSYCCETLFPNTPNPSCTAVKLTDGRDQGVCHVTASCKGVDPLMPCHYAGRKELLTDEQCQATCCVSTNGNDTSVAPVDEVYGI